VDLGVLGKDPESLELQIHTAETGQIKVFDSKKSFVGKSLGDGSQAGIYGISDNALAGGSCYLRSRKGGNAQQQKGGYGSRHERRRSGSKTHRCLREEKKEKEKKERR